MSKNKSKAKLSDIKGVLRYLKPYTLMIVLSVMFAAATVVLTLYVPILVGDAIDCIVEAGKVDFAAIMPILTRTGVIILATALLQWLMSNNRITFDVVRDMRKAAFAKLQILPLAYIDSKPSGEIVSRVIADVDTFADGLLLGFTQLFTGVMTILGTLVFMFRLNALIALAVVVITPLSLFVASFISKRTYSMFTAQSEVRGEQTALIDEAVGGQKLVKAFSHQPEILSQFDEINGRLEKCSLKATFFSSTTNPCTRFVNALVYAAVGVLGTTLLSLLSEWVVGGFALPMESIAAALMYACIVLLLTAISLPPMFRFGVEKGRLFYFVFVGAFVALIFGFGERLSALLAGDAALPVLLLAAVVVLPSSAALSAAGYGKRCFS